jgi:hypothetical protein
MQSNPSSSIGGSVTILAQEKLDALPRNNVNYRILQALLENAPTKDGEAVIAADIITASEEENGLVRLAEFCTTGLILPSEPPFNSDSSVIGFLTDTACWQ